MKFIALREDFLKGVNIANKAVSTNNTLPILNNILLKSEGNKVYYEATNLEIAIRVFINADIENEGKITVPAKLFQSYISLLTDNEVSIAIGDGYTVNIQSGESKTQIKGLPAIDFPKMPIVEPDFTLKIPVKDLAMAINQVAFAASDNSARPILSGVLLFGQGNILKLVATDSYRLAEKTLFLEKPLDNDLKIIIPAKTMIELGRLITETDLTDITCIISSNQILFRFGSIEFTSRLIDGLFPNYNQIIPQTSRTKIILDKGLLLQSVKRVGLFARENKNNIKLIINQAEQIIKITTDATQIGTEEEKVEAKIEGEDNRIALNSEYLIDLLTVLPNGEISIIINDKLSPALVEHSQIHDYIHIVMPLKL